MIQRKSPKNQIIECTKKSLFKKLRVTNKINVKKAYRGFDDLNIKAAKLEYQTSEDQLHYGPLTEIVSPTKPFRNNKVLINDVNVIAKSCRAMFWLELIKSKLFVTK